MKSFSAVKGWALNHLEAVARRQARVRLAEHSRAKTLSHPLIFFTRGVSGHTPGIQ